MPLDYYYHNSSHKKKSTIIHISFDWVCWIIEKAREFQKNIYFCFIDYVKAFDYVEHKKLWKILKEMVYQTT